MAKKDKESAPEPQETGAAVAEAKPAQKQDFLPGGRFAHKATDPKVAYLDAVYVENDGQEYEAKICPLPWNKCHEEEQPPAGDMKAELAELASLVGNRRKERFDEINAKWSKMQRVLVNDQTGEVMRLAEYKGHTFAGLEDGQMLRPCVDMLINFSRDPERKESSDKWVFKACVLPIEHVRKPAKGGFPPCHFKLANV